MKNYIGIDGDKAKVLSAQLNDLLANYQLYYQNLRGFHWNIKGAAFFELHAKFEELYNSANLAVDEIAERILTLGETPFHTFEEYIKHAKISAGKDVTLGKEAVQETLNNLTILLEKERTILAVAADANDEGTVTLMSDYINTQEKIIWMLNAYLN